ncbi:hypothetical protein BC829DRAFT_389506 [Chytridium lagenaria]|nr:hypothetical protein BC829DRAFT_389506 [Chytridium lagenaria]
MACLGVAFASNHHRPNDADNGLITGISLATLKSNLYPTAKFQLKEPLSYLVPCFVRAAELRDPLRAIPIGGFTAIALSTGLYCVLFLLIGSVATREDFWPCLGSFLLGLGASSMQCLMIASRTLVSISDMDVLPKLPFFHRFQKSNGTKGLSTLTAILITWFIAVPLVLIPDFEFLAILVTMCFLICYASTCFACFLLSVFRPPSWRPHFRAHWVFPLMGFVMCVFFMVTLNWIAALSALVGSVLLSYIIQTRSDHTTLGAGIQSLLYYMAINHLHMREEEDHQKKHASSHLSLLSNARTLLFSADLQSEPVAFEIETSRRSNLLVEGIWRPQVIGFITFEEGEDGTLRPERRGSALVAFIGQMRSGSFRGGDLCILASVITPFDEEVAMRMFSRGRGRRGVERRDRVLLPTPKEVVIQELLFRRKMLLRYMLEDEFVFGFAKNGESLLMQASGLGDFTPNTVCALWPSDTGSDTEGADQQFINIRWTSLVMGQNSVFLKVAESSEFPSANQSCGGSIDIWWIFKHGEIMLLIAYLMQQSSTWKSATLRLFIISRSLEEAPLLRSEISAKLKLLRIKVHSLQVVTVQERPLTTSINLPYGEENEQTLMDLLATSTDDNTDILHPSPFFTSLKEEMYLYSKGPVTDLIMVDLPCSDDWIVDSFERTMGQLLFREFCYF